MASLATLKSELAAAACFLCLPVNNQQAIKAYLFAVKAGGSLDPKTLLSQASGFRGIQPGLLPALQAVFANIIAGGTGDFPTAISQLQCDISCLTEQNALAIQISQLANSLPGPTDPKTLAKLSACFTCLPTYQLTLVQTLAMGVASGVIPLPTPGGPPPTVPPPFIKKAVIWSTLGSKLPLVVNLGLPPTVPVTPPGPPPPTFPLTTDWVNRVIANGGAKPSNSTITASQTFETSISSLKSRIWHLNFIAPDSFIAMRTPFIKTFGIDPWVRHNVGTGGVGESLTVNGWNPGADRTNCQIYDTGVVPSAIPSFSASNQGISVYDSDAVTTNLCTNSVMGGFDNTSAYQLRIDQATFNNDLLILNGGGASSVTVAADHVGGFWMGSRTASNVLTLYKARSNLAWAVWGSDATANAVAAMTTNVYFGGDLYPAALLHGTANLYSFMAVHDGFSNADGQTLFNAAQAFRVALGGGFL